MVLMFIVVSAIAASLVLLGWLWCRSRRPQSLLVFMLPLFGIGGWGALAAAGVGAQSLANLIEVFGVAAAAIVVAYASMFAFDHSPQRRPQATVIAFIAVAMIVLGLRLLTPVLAE
jgi:hypothetical protein